MVDCGLLIIIILMCFHELILVGYGAGSPGNGSSAAVVIEVDRSGNGDYRKIQDAIDAVSFNNTDHVIILIKPGVYEEKIVVPEEKPFITLSGSAEAGETVIRWDDSGEIFESPTLSVLASDFMARYLTIQNSYGVGAKAVALRVSGDRAAFLSCRILGHQDTLLDDKGRHFYLNSYIEGDTDFIFGNGASLFERCHLHSLSRGNGAITAQRRLSAEEETGFTFLKCKITGAAVRSAVLGRPWGSHSRVIYALTYMSNVISPQGWDDWGNSSNQRTAFYGEYKSYGEGAETWKRVNWSHILSNKEAAPYLSHTITGGANWIRSMPSQFRANFPKGSP